MSSKGVMVMVVTVMVMLVTPVHPRPHQAPKESDKIESAVSESLKQIEAAIIIGAKKIESAIEQRVQDKMLKESASKMEQQGQESAKSNAALQRILAKIFAARTKAGTGTVKESAAVPASAKDATADTTTTSTTTTTTNNSITTTTTTTMDPLDEYCKEACDAGLGGPECDCPEHPIG